MLRDNKILIEFLQTLVSGWGKDAVLKELEKLGNERFPVGPSSIGTVAREREQKRLRSAVQQVELLEEDEDKREFLKLIATKYDQKKFLPSFSDVREFIAIRGKGNHVVKDRPRAFILLLNLLREMSPSQLQELAHSKNFSGPSELAPISNAIKAAGEARRDRPVLDSFPDTSQSDVSTSQEKKSS